ncbi:NUDIX hydrolase [Opitutus terrae]|uniref:NUDIX hydrolase n=1 Tax=Opitutus terrae (strain DSM 11246 / JCM 15787 / PB90-1) TaxID=452637 RepID=B1ZS59_OPITP|nr:NUDIX domain-containing protein [Opitutus terrae]ACB75658.1 NUDIX hydrolase [Opitutus terrae PB90-1]
MADEFFDVVNERDEPVGRARRSEVHAKGWRHRAVHVLVFDQHGRVFVQKRSMKKDCSPGLWDSSCSGHLDAGEDYDAAAVRELEEELGMKVSAPPKRWFRIEACEETGQEFCWIYWLRANGPFVLHPEEIDGGDWLTPDELTARVAARPGDYCTSFRLIWERARREGMPAQPQPAPTAVSHHPLAALRRVTASRGVA